MAQEEDGQEERMQDYFLPLTASSQTVSNGRHQQASDETFVLPLRSPLARNAQSASPMQAEARTENALKGSGGDGTPWWFDSFGSVPNGVSRLSQCESLHLAGPQGSDRRLPTRSPGSNTSDAASHPVTELSSIRVLAGIGDTSEGDCGGPDADVLHNEGDDENSVGSEDAAESAVWSRGMDQALMQEAQRCDEEQVSEEHQDQTPMNPTSALKAGARGNSGQRTRLRFSGIDPQNHERGPDTLTADRVRDPKGSSPRLYEFWSFKPIPMHDILEDGVPPDERARPQPLHYNLEVTLREGKHFPAGDMGGHMVTIAFHDQLLKSKCSPTNSDCCWDESTNFFLHAVDIVHALQAAQSPSEEPGPCLQIDCSNHNILTTHLGGHTLMLKTVLREAFASQGTSRTVTLCDSKGLPVIGASGEATSISLFLRATRVKQDHKWTPPTLQDTLNCSEGKGNLRSPYRSLSLSGTGTHRLGKMHSMSRKNLLLNDSDQNPSLALARPEQGPEDAQVPILARRETSVLGDHVCRRSTSMDNEYRLLGRTQLSAQGRRDLRTLTSTGQGHSGPDGAENDWSESDDDGDDAESRMMMLSNHEDEGQTFYWRETLHRSMESLSVNAMVVLLIFIDVGNVLFVLVKYTDSGHEPLEHMVLTMVVLSLFVVELLLRMLAQQRRFWLNLWNVFDVIVIFGSVVIACIKYTLLLQAEGKELDASSAVFLRFISRVAIAFRVTRVIINLRKARKISGFATTAMRVAVSQNRRRFNKSGFDLDLTYITSRVIAMSAPCFGAHTSYRNDIHVVSRFLSLRHYGHFLVFNLCDSYMSSDGVIGNYHPQMIFNQVQRIPFEDHGPPLMTEMIFFCEESCRWLEQDPNNCIAAHCKGGKGRTGVMISALLLWCGHRRCAMDAMELFTFRRTANYDPEKGFGDASPDDGDAVADSIRSKLVLLCGGAGKDSKDRKQMPNQGPEGPSQIRYVHYLEAMLYSGIDPLHQRKRFLRFISLPVSAAQKHEPWFLSFSVRCMRVVMYDSARHLGMAHVVGGSDTELGEVIKMPVNAVIFGDTRVDFFLHGAADRATDANRRLAFFVCFNMAFYEDENDLTFRKNKVDMLCKNSQIEQDYQVGCHLKPTPSGLPRMPSECQDDHSLNAERLMDERQLDRQRAYSERALVEEAFERIFLTYAERRSFAPGDIVLKEDDERMLMWISKGAVEGVVHEAYDTQHQHRYHPMGNNIQTVPAAAGRPAKGDQPWITLSSKRMRRPLVMMFGCRSVLGASQYLHGEGNIEFRARTPVEVLVLYKEGKTGESPSSPSKQKPFNHNSPQRDLPDGVRSGTTRTKEKELIKTESTIFKLLGDQPRFDETKVIGLSISDIEICGVPNSLLADMYHGLALDMAHKLSRARIEAVRMSGLKAFNDRQSVMHLEDELQKLRSDCIDKFQLPVNEKIINTAKATVLISRDRFGGGLEEMGGSIRMGLPQSQLTSRKASVTQGLSEQKHGSSFFEAMTRRGQTAARGIPKPMKIGGMPGREGEDVSEHGREISHSLSTDSFETGMNRDGVPPIADTKVRVILMSNHIILDPEIFGPVVSWKSEILRASQLHAVYMKSKAHEKCLVLEVQGERLHGLELVTNMRMYQFSFQSTAAVQYIFNRLQEMCKKAHEKRKRHRERYFESPHMHFLLEKCSRVHQLRKGQTLLEAATTDSLFVVRTGQIKLKRDGLVFQQIFEGECFGTTEFIERTVSGRFTAVAACKTHVLQLLPDAVRAIVSPDTVHASLFYWTLCQVMDIDFREAMEEMYPGTWSQKK